jgi:hypothetical protein
VLFRSTVTDSCCQHSPARGLLCQQEELIQPEIYGHRAFAADPLSERGALGLFSTDLTSAYIFFRPNTREKPYTIAELRHLQPLLDGVSPAPHRKQPAAAPQPSGLGWSAGLAVLLGARLLAAASLMITDCDETFNYWEPTHYTLYGWGFQTWEYSPAYALRSYLFLLPHSAAVSALHAASGSKVVAFYGARKSTLPDVPF